MVPRLPGENGWERWRGEVDAERRDTEETLAVFWKFRDDTNRRLAIMETKMVIFAALAAAFGAMIPGAAAAILKAISGAP